MKEPVSSHLCLDCGHLITDHKKAGLGGVGRRERMERAKEFARREQCLGDRGRCLCKTFVQPHTFTRHTVSG
jgi:hypothetical protein